MSAQPSGPLPLAAPARCQRARVEDEHLLSGQARFIADVAPAGCLHMVFVRSPMSRARLRRVDDSRAAQSPGVSLVLTGQSVKRCRWLSVNPVFGDMRPILRSVLACDKVDAVGEAVAAVVADTEFHARDAAELLDVDYECREPLPDIDTARHGEAIYDQWQDNVAFEHHWTHGDCQACFATASRLVRIRLDLPRIAAVALETRGAVAAWDERTASLTAWLPTQTPHRARAELARMLDLDPSRVRVIAPSVGGAFGAKASIYPEDVLVCLASIRLGRPVKWIATRNEDFVATSHGRGGRLHAEAAITEDGRFRGLRAELTFPIGFWATHSAAVPAWNCGRILPGPYRIANVDIRVIGLVTNAAPVGILRGAGRPEAALIMERLMDEAAGELHLDPAEVRRINLLEPSDMPYPTPTGETLDSGDYGGLLEQALEMSRYREITRDRAISDDGRLLGVGICMYVEPCGRGWESARVSREVNGRYLVACGSSAQGQGHQTTFARIAAACLNVPSAQIDVVEGDTAIAPEGVGALASRSVAIGGSAVKAAADRLRELLSTARPAGTGRIETSVIYSAPMEAWSSGCCIAVVEIDRTTGELKVRELFCVEDCGSVIEPTLARGQLEGGLVQGMGHIVRERIVYDDQGQLLTGSLMDYALPRADEIPTIHLCSMPTRSGANLLGAKGVGESGCIAAPAAILNAAHAAVRYLGVDSLSLPLTSESIWRSLNRAPHPTRCG